MYLFITDFIPLHVTNCKGTLFRAYTQGLGGNIDRKLRILRDFLRIVYNFYELYLLFTYCFETIRWGTCRFRG